MNNVNNEKLNLEESNNDNSKVMYSEQQVLEKLEAQKAEFENSFEKKFNRKLGKELSKRSSEEKQKDKMIKAIQERTGASDINELWNNIKEQYGIEDDESNNSLDEKDQAVLGKNDAQEFIEIADTDELDETINELSNTKRNARQEASLKVLKEYREKQKSKADLEKQAKEAGIDDNLLNSDGFKEFLGKFNKTTPLKEVVDMYNSISGKEKAKPFNTGSITSTKVTTQKIKDFYTFEEAQQFTKEDFLKNPGLAKAIDKSAALWFKRK